MEELVIIRAARNKGELKSSPRAYTLELFFPCRPTRGRIACWDAESGHGEAVLPYYHGCKYVDPASDEAIELFLRYEKGYGYEDKKYKLKPVKRLPLAALRKAWREAYRITGRE